MNTTSRTPSNAAEVVHFPLLKFSYVTTASSHGPFPWTHLTQQNKLLAVFENVASISNYGPVQRRMHFKVYTGEELFVSKFSSRIHTFELSVNALSVLRILFLGAY